MALGARLFPEVKYLLQAHNADGTLKVGSIAAAQIVDGAITPAKLGSLGVANGVATLNSSGVVPDNQLPGRLSTALMPAAGTAGQVLTKSSTTDYDASWADRHIDYVTVATGAEARPSASLVLWIGGTTQPTNMATKDVWLKAS